ncbi:hypothetical protein [Brevundimonas nasdae]|uniref:Uncharacterized protein n=1 Tax=Brevundimonas nasdae TaxID=172043 RepID=A0ABX8TH49_9CAUL|nr:hypothetical protein [Brevundimonas nasdae]QYC09135.1 hypothetical protein KWG56_10875 [Brevundimonas nasdae]QYC15185.1 hypothetical protein KWG63_06210 [Brevundimonas nasdae]
MRSVVVCFSPECAGDSFGDCFSTGYQQGSGVRRGGSGRLGKIIADLLHHARLAFVSPMISQAPHGGRIVGYAATTTVA